MLRARGMPVVPHAVSLSLGGAEPLDRARVAHLGRRRRARSARRWSASTSRSSAPAGSRPATCCRCRAPARRSTSLVRQRPRRARPTLPVPLALENDRGAVRLAGRRADRGRSSSPSSSSAPARCCCSTSPTCTPTRSTSAGPAGAARRAAAGARRLRARRGRRRARRRLPRHARPRRSRRRCSTCSRELCARHRPPAVLLERDDDYPPDAELAAELAAIRAVVDGGAP